MRRSLTGLLAAGAALALTLTACSSGSESASAPANSEAPAATTAAADSSDAGSVLAAANIQSVIESYTGPLSELPASFGEPDLSAALKIGWASPNDSNELVKRLGEAVKAATEAAGGEFVTYDAMADPSQQVSQIQQLVNDGVDAITMWPLDATALAPALKVAKEAGIPVVSMEVTPDGSPEIGDVAGQVVYGRDMQAYVGARLMSQLFPGAQVATAKFAVPVPSMVFYAERAAAYAAEDGLEVVGTFDNPNDTVAGGESMMGPILSKYPDIKGLLAYNDPTAIGATAAAKAAMTELTAFGVNGEDAGIEAVKSGKLSLTIQPPVDLWGRELVGGAYLAKAGVEIPKTIFPSLGNVITAETVASAKKLNELIATGS